MLKHHIYPGVDLWYNRLELDVANVQISSYLVLSFALYLLSCISARRHIWRAVEFLLHSNLIGLSMLWGLGVVYGEDKEEREHLLLSLRVSLFVSCFNQCLSSYSSYTVFVASELETSFPVYISDMWDWDLRIGLLEKTGDFKEILNWKTGDVIIVIINLIPTVVFCMCCVALFIFFVFDAWFVAVDFLFSTVESV